MNGLSDRELERFKTEINLSEYAAHCGYKLIRRESSRNSIKMRRSERDQIVIARPHPDSFARDVAYSSKDRQAILHQCAAMRAVEEHPYLTARAIGKEILSDSRFAGKVWMDRHGAAIFPHEDEQRLCGYEIKNAGFTGFAAGGEKTLWRSNEEPHDARLVLCESGIDALSYHALHPDPRARYASAGGGWSDKTRMLIQRAAADHPGEEIALAFDNDDQGREYEAAARALLAGAGKTIAARYPAHGKDWNEQLQAERRKYREMARRSPPETYNAR